MTFRERLLDGLVDSIVERGFRGTSVTDIVRHAKTSRRTFYQEFSSREDCFHALIKRVGAQITREISAAVDPAAQPEAQVRQAVSTYFEIVERQPELSLSWVRETPALGDEALQVLRDTRAGYADLLAALTDTENLRAIGVRPVSKETATMLVGGVRELTALFVEEGHDRDRIVEAAVAGSLALLLSSKPR